MADRGSGGAPVEVVDLRKSFGAVSAVAGVSLRVAAGEFLALLGPSGSGKTTILNIIAGFEHPDAGEVLIDGRSVTDLPANRRNLGMVFQRYALFPHMSVADNISFPLRMRGVAAQERRRRAEDLLATVRLEGYADRRPGQLSGGQQQRVAFARAVAHNPPALLMDEPLAALDKKLREQMQLELKQIQRQLGVTVVLVTHDQTEALTMADRIAVLNEGRLVQVGTPQELYEQPSSGFVADFIGETNLLEGRVLTVSDGLTAIEVGGHVFHGRLAADPLTPGTAACLALRPERIVLGQPVPGEGGTEGRIAQVVYGGSSTAYHVALAAGPTLVARVPATGATPRAVGEPVRLAWSPGDARVYAAARA